MKKIGIFLILSIVLALLIGCTSNNYFDKTRFYNPGNAKVSKLTFGEEAGKEILNLNFYDEHWNSAKEFYLSQSSEWGSRYRREGLSSAFIAMRSADLPNATSVGSIIVNDFDDIYNTDIVPSIVVHFLGKVLNLYDGDFPQQGNIWEVRGHWESKGLYYTGEYWRADTAIVGFSFDFTNNELFYFVFDWRGKK